MNNSLGHQLNDLLPASLGCVLLPLPAILFWRSHDGRATALLLFSIACASLVAYAFRRDFGRRMTDAVESPEVLPLPATEERGEGRGEGRPQPSMASSPRPPPPSEGGEGVRRPGMGEVSGCAQLWRQRTRTVAAALFLAFIGFSLESLALGDGPDFVSVFLAFLVLIPAICVVPFLTLATRRPVAAVVFALFIVFCMKLLGGIVVVLVYGWNASQHGHTDMPWTHPNLLVWLFWFNTGVLSLLLYHLGARRFQARFGTP